MVSEYGVPTIPGSEEVRNFHEALVAAQEIGFPLILKAPEGGGSRGMKLVMNPDDLRTAFETAVAEVRVAFWDEVLYMERYLPNIRHIEVQILADRLGNAIHLGERDCSLQRRYQKVIEG
jgi:acetyl-CoA carboxylase biotin carboxylase subunit